MLKGVHLTLLIGPVVPLPAPQPLIDALQKVQVTSATGQRSGFQLSFALSKDSILSRMLIPAGFFDPPTRVIVVVTVNGMPHVLIDGVITRQDVTASGAVGGSTLTVTGEDVSVMMDMIDFSGIPYPAMPDVAIANLLIAKYFIYGLIPLAIPSPVTDVPIPTSRIPTQIGTDLAYIQYMADQSGYVFFVEPGPVPGTNIAYWGPEVRLSPPQPALTVNMDAESNVEQMTFGFDGLSREQQVLLIQEPFSQLAIPIPVPPISLLRPPLALRQPMSLKIRVVRGLAKQNALRAALIGLSKVNAGEEAVTASGELDVLRYGHVLRARRLVGVRGAGIAYDGLYYVKSVTHELTRGGFKQSFQLARNGLVSLTPAVPV